MVAESVCLRASPAAALNKAHAQKTANIQRRALFSALQQQRQNSARPIKISSVPYLRYPER
jgi:hypothetical protein